MSTTPWITSAKSNADQQCVEQRRNGTIVQMRDSKQQGNGPILSTTPTAYQQLLQGAKNGELDLLPD